MSGRLPLSGIRVLDFTLVWAGPYGIMLLSDLGAEVIRVESCQHHITNTRGGVPRPTKDQMPYLGAQARLYADFDPKDDPWNRHATFNAVGRDRYSMTVDLTKPEGVEIVLDLAQVSDVLLDNNTVGLLDRFGLGYQQMKSRNPTMIYVTMPIYGLAGPYKDYLGYGMNAEAISGLSSLRAHAGIDPTAAGATNHMDAASGVGAAFAILVALHERERIGRGQYIEFCQLEHLFHQIGGPLMDAAMNQRVGTGIGNRDAICAPQGIYPCQGEGRWLAVTVAQIEEWHSLCRVIGREDLTYSHEYHTNIARQIRHDEIDAWITEWTSKQDAREAMERLQEVGIAAAVVASDRDVYEDPHLEERGFFHWVDHPSAGRFRYPGHGYKLSETPLRYDSPAPMLGQHNDLVYRQLLGLPSSDITRLTKLGHIGDRYTDQV